MLKKILQSIYTNKACHSILTVSLVSQGVFSMLIKRAVSRSSPFMGRKGKELAEQLTSFPELLIVSPEQTLRHLKCQVVLGGRSGQLWGSTVPRCRQA